MEEDVKKEFKERLERVDISGFEGPYENACQTMLERFIEWSKNKDYEQIFPKGKLSEENEEQLSTIVKDIDPSGAMWGATLSHFAYILKNGYNAWIKSGKEKNGIIEWNPKSRIHFDSPKEAFESGLKLGKKLKKE